MKVSIITVCLNAASTISDAIESVIAQTHPDIEHIIIDGGSTDGTLDVISRYKDEIHCVVSEPDNGIYDAMNKGISIASGEVIGILNSDDIYEDDKVIEDVVEKFASTKADIVLGDVVWVDRENLSCIRRYYSSERFEAWKLRIGWMPPHPATFIKSKAYKQAGPYSLEYQIASDYEMFVRLMLVHHFQFVRLPRVLVRMRMGGISTSGIRSLWIMNMEIIKACKRNNVYTNIFFILTKVPFKLLELYKKPKGVGSRRKASPLE